MHVAHFSDPHLLSLRGVSPLAFVGKRITGGMNLLFNRGHEYSSDVVRALVQDLNQRAPDHVIVSGDVTNLALPPEFELVREVLETVALPPSEISVVPGNHDCYTRGARRRDDFARVLGPFMQGELGPGRFPFARLRGDVAIIGLSTARPSPPGIAVGTLGAAQLAAARALLEHPEVVRRCRVVVLHHAPRSPHVAWHSRLTDAAAFMRLIAACGAELVLHGHLHRDSREELAGPRGPVPVIGVTSASWLSPRDPARRAAYNIYEIDGGELRGVERRAYDVETRRFG